MDNSLAIDDDSLYEGFVCSCFSLIYLFGDTNSSSVNNKRFNSSVNSSVLLVSTSNFVKSKLCCFAYSMNVGTNLRANKFS